MTCLGLLFPATAFALWLQNDGACVAQPYAGQSAAQSVAQLASEVAEIDASIVITSDDCDEVNDPTDISNNVCFELAEHPISTLPDLIAQTQAERAALQLLNQVFDQLPPALSSPDLGAGSEDVSTPDDVRFAKPRAFPRHTPNACAVYPDSCETAPTLPTLNLDGTPNATTPCGELNLPPPPLAVTTRDCLSSTGPGPATGIVTRLDRPPQFR